MTECRHGLSEDCPACMQATIDDLRAQLASAAQATREPSAMTERLIQAAVDYEQAGGQHAAAARRELSEARAAIEAALSTVPSTHQREDDELSEWKQAASVEAGLRREFMAQVDAAREFVKRHPALTLIDLAEFEAFLKVPAMVDAALSSTNLGSPATGTPSREPTGEYTITPAHSPGEAQ